MKKSSVERATEGRPTQTARSIKDTVRKYYFTGILANGRSVFLACLVSLRPLQPIEPEFDSPHVQLLTSAIL